MPLRIDLFCEDFAHEAFARAAIERIADEEEIEITVRVVTARFGLPRLRRELRAYVELTARHAGTPDLLVVVADANTDGPGPRRQEIETVGLGDVFPEVVIGTPDPCVEAWFVADPRAIGELFGAEPDSSAGDDCESLKTALRDALERSGEVLTHGGAEFAREIVKGASLYRAGRTEPTLKQFLDDLRGVFRRAG